MKAIIMAGGEGTRLRPMTCTCPKPMVPICSVPVMEHIINLLKKYQITEIGVTLRYMQDEIKEYFGDGSALEVSLTYFSEDKPYGTAGSVKGAEVFLDETFLVISGDTLTDIDLSHALDFHTKKNADATIVLCRQENPPSYGVVVTDEAGRIDRFLEKPDWSRVCSDNINTGIYILNPDVLSMIPGGSFFDFARDLFPEMLASGKSVFGCCSQGYWCDIGDIEMYLKCHRDVLDGKTEISMNAKEIMPGVYAEAGVSIPEGVEIKPPMYICSGAKIHAGAVVGEYSVIGAGCEIRTGASIKRSVIWSGTVIKNNCAVRGAVICENVKIGDMSRIYENAVIGMNTQIGESCLVAPNIKIWPEKVVMAGARIKENLVWGSRISSRLFSERGIRGDLNVDITPEFAAKLGAALGAYFSGGNVGIGCDSGAASDMLMSSLGAGLISSGAGLYQFGEQALPITRSAVKFYNLKGGIHLSLREEGGRTIPEFEFIDSRGASFTREQERTLEQLFMQESFIRGTDKLLKKPMRLEGYKYYYLQGILSGITCSGFSKNMRIQTKSKTISELLDVVLGDIERDMTMPIAEYEFTGEISEDGERLTLFDENGIPIRQDNYLALISVIILKRNPSAVIVLPIDAASSIEMMIGSLGGSVVFSGLAHSAFMDKILQCGTEDQFKMCFDGIYAAVYILDFLNRHNISFESMAKQIPAVYKCEREVYCPDERKGRVIRELINQYNVRHDDAPEGIKIKSDDGWVLVIPDNYKRTCRIISEGADIEAADELSGVFAEKIKKLANS